MHDFDAFVAIDWSGARGPRLPGLAAALARPGRDAPQLIKPPDNNTWTRPGLIRWLNSAARDKRLLVGADFSFAPPYLDRNSYFPGVARGPDQAQEFWDWLAARADSENFYAGKFVRMPDIRPHFLLGRDGDPANYRRYRVTEQACRKAGLGAAESFFHLVGATQVGLASLSGMLALRALKPFAIWPFDAIGQDQSVMVEIYTRIFLTRAGAGSRKIRTRAGLNRALAGLGSKPFAGNLPLTDHMTDALVSAAGLRALAGDRQVWNPRCLSDRVRASEGWTFGVV